MAANVLTIGNKIELTKEVHGQVIEKPVTYTSQILDLLDHNHIKAAMPSYHGRIIPLDLGTIYTTIFYNGKGLFRCRCEVVDRYRDEKFYYVILKMVSDLEKYQRREYYRMSCTMNAFLRDVSKEEEICLRKIRQKEYVSDDEYWKCMAKLDGCVKNWKEAVIIDLSGGGARLNSTGEYEDGSSIYMKISFQFRKISYEYELLSKVISHRPLEAKPGLYETRIEFQGITNKERENIIQFIFEEERKKRKKEMGLE